MKKLIWVGSSQKDLKNFPRPIQHAMGYALFNAQIGKMHQHAKTLSGMGSAKIQEIRENDKSGTYRVIYTMEFGEFIFILHAFQKKSKSGIATPKQEIELLGNRFKEAKALYKSLMEKKI
ncbi:MAG: type II toxin-antitoxin system RelE/ParE family toxin [Chlamydiae bacterium]|nr:type II toxin-antitoxin system RelE/ParE family toxin [Chlamydiota bacterium]